MESACYRNCTGLGQSVCLVNHDEIPAFAQGTTSYDATTSDMRHITIRAG